MPPGWETPAVDPIVPGDAQPSEPIGLNSVPPGVPTDAGTDDKMESTVDAAVSMANARLAELEGDVYPMDATIGDLMVLPDTPGASSKMTGPPAGY